MKDRGGKNILTRDKKGSGKSKKESGRLLTDFYGSDKVFKSHE